MWIKESATEIDIFYSLNCLIWIVKEIKLEQTYKMFFLICISIISPVAIFSHVCNWDKRLELPLARSYLPCLQKCIKITQYFPIDSSKACSHTNFLAVIVIFDKRVCKILIHNAWVNAIFNH